MKHTYTLDEMAEILQKSRPGVLDAVARGEIPEPTMLGRRYRWSVSVVDAWLESGMPKQTGDME